MLISPTLLSPLYASLHLPPPDRHDTDKKPSRVVYMDGAWDMFHAGHIQVRGGGDRNGVYFTCAVYHLRATMTLISPIILISVTNVISLLAPIALMSLKVINSYATMTRPRYIVALCSAF